MPAHITIENFLSKSNTFAIVGASSNKEKWGYKIYKKLKDSGFSVIPINPKKEMIDEDISYSDLKSINKTPDVVITIVPPWITEKIVRTCNELGIKKVWMQPGSESENAVKFCEDNGIECIHHACFVVDGIGDKF